METYSFKTVSDIVKEEAKGRYSRDEDTLANGSGIVAIGTILGEVSTTGKMKPLKVDATDGTQNAAGIIIQHADARSGDVPIVTLKRRAQVVLQNLVFPAGIDGTQTKVAIAQLKALGIVARHGV